MMVLQTCQHCGIRFYAPLAAQQKVCWRCERSTRTADTRTTDEIAERLLAEVFPHGLPANP